jgi:4-cresol dehydrogenase (hydroxylating) flavoprotein subunit
MENLARALEAWQDVLGPEHVLTDAATISAAQTATFHTTQRIPAVIRPGSREEVQECVRVANEYKTPIYPVSTGKNWGLGSRVPPADGCVLMELRRLERILDFDEKLAYVTVEPGVTFRQLHEFLRAQKSNLMMSMTGSTPDSSLVGNALERGVGSGLYSDRFAHACALEVVLPTGECVHTGFGRFPDAKAANLHRWGVGPYTDGIFTQSNLGIVTKMTLWLAPTPKYLQACLFGIEDDSRLEDLMDALQTLKLEGLFKGGFRVSNDYMTLPRVVPQYPWEALDGRTPFPAELLETIKRTFWRNAWWSSLWTGEGALHSGSQEQGLAERKIIERALRDKVDRLVFVDEAEVAFSRWDTPGDRSAAAEYFGRPGDGPESFDLELPSDLGVARTYWRKRTAPPADMDPDRDRCGLIYCAVAVPFDGRHVRAASNIMTDAMKAYKFEPFLEVICISERSVYILAPITYDREVAGEDAQALACHDDMLRRLIEKGYIPYRLGIRSVKLLPAAGDDYEKMLGALKKALDPNGILAPGRYGLQPDRLGGAQESK